MQKLVLFDIDGTLLWTSGAGRRAIRSALMASMGTAGPIDGYRFDGKTDPQIIRELMTSAGHPHAESVPHIEQVCERYVTLLAGELTSAPPGSTSVYPGVLPLLDRLDARPDVLIGLLTGNVVGGAELKLAAAGLSPGRFRVGAYGSDAAERSALPPIAAARAATLMGRVPNGAEVVIIGDTPMDVACGQSINARAIGVGTGSYRRHELMNVGAYAAFDDLRETDAVLEAIFG